MSHRTKTSNCPSCGSRLTAATNVDGDHRPLAGDLTVCVYCGHLMAFADDLAVRELNDEEIKTAAGDPAVIAVQRARFEAMRERAGIWKKK